MRIFERVVERKWNWMFWLGMLIEIVAVLDLGPAALAIQVRDVTAADDVDIGTGQAPSGQSLSQQQSDYKILWDTSHGIYLDYQPSGRFQLLVQNLASNGFIVDTTNQGFLVDDPAGYNVLVVCLGSSWDSSYNSVEVTRIANFVNNGGGLLIMGDNTSCPNANIQPAASAFGISLGLSRITPQDTYTSNLASHYIFEGVNQIYMRAAGEISAIEPSIELAWQEGTGKALVAAGTCGYGRIVTLGDHLWSNFWIYYADNHQFSINTFEYLAIPEPGTLLLFGLGCLALLRKQRV